MMLIFRFVSPAGSIFTLWYTYFSIQMTTQAPFINFWIMFYNTFLQMCYLSHIIKIDAHAHKILFTLTHDCGTEIHKTCLRNCNEVKTLYRAKKMLKPRTELQVCCFLWKLKKLLKDMSLQSRERIIIVTPVYSTGPGSTPVNGLVKFDRSAVNEKIFGNLCV